MIYGVRTPTPAGVVLMNEESIFCEALQKPTPEARAAFLEAACAGDAALRRAVDGLLRAHERAGAFLAVKDAGRGAIPDDSISERPGTIIGPYKLMEQIGEGGMGLVFVAEQQRPVRRKVALKVIKPGMDTRQVIARFEAERQALALMDHPNIAKVFDGGTTGEKDEGGRLKDEKDKTSASDSSFILQPSSFRTGRPYFVMELVKGVPITDYCDENQLTPRERLGLFLDVCHAVQHAHQKGIIHRDIKPSNVLIASHDGVPVVKIIDFGVAKAVGQHLTERTLYTQFTQLIGTPLYMSPEQAGQSALDVDTRSDIYSLGVLLYELLTGTTPFDKERLSQASYEEIRRIIREEEPPKPSTRISTVGQAATTLSTQRKSDPKQLSRLFRGELDWIVMKALEKDRNRRYETASAFAADVQRYLNDEVVEARPPSALYRFRKLVRRHKRGFAMASFAAAVLVAGVAALAASNVRIGREKQQKEAALQEKEKVLERERQNGYYQRIALAEREWSANNLGRMQQLLADCPEDLRGWEWYYLKRLPCGELPPLRHGEAVLRVAFSPDGHRLASGSRGGFVTLWDVETGQKLSPGFQAHERGTPSVAFSPDGHLLATGGDSGDGTVVLWAAETGQRLRPLEGRSTGVSQVAFSPDGQRLVSVGWVESAEIKARGEMRIWEVPTGKPVLTVLGHEPRMTSVAWNPDGQRLATGSADSTVSIWDARTGEEQRTFHGHRQAVYCVAFSPDGRQVASGDGKTSYTNPVTVKVWDSATGHERFTLHGHLGTIYSVAFSPDGRRLASASIDRTVKLWDVATGQETLTLRGHLDAVRGVAFSPDGRRLASASLDRTVRLWNAAPLRDEDANCLTLPEVGGDVTSVAFHPTQPQTVAAASGDGRVRVWDLSLGRPRCLHTLVVGNEAGVSALAFSRQGRWLAAVAGRELTLWNAVTYEAVCTVSAIPGLVCVAFSPDEKQVAAAGFGKAWMRSPVHLWDVANDHEPRMLSGNTWMICQVAFHPDGQHLATTCVDGSVRLWEVKTGKRLDTPALTPTCPSFGLAFSPDGQQLALGSNDQGVRVWDTTTWNLRHEYRDPGAVQSVAFSPDGRRLAWGSTDSTVKVWDLPDGRAERVSPLIHTLHGHTNWVLSVAFSPDGRHIASASADGTVKIWPAPPVAEPATEKAGSQDP
jgi:WD40 repeat protein/serine/threonine protein kinase